MESFSFGTFVLGLIMVILSSLFVGFHQKIADAIGSGVSDYQNYKKWGLIALGISILVMTNVHNFLLSMLVGLFFKR